MMSTKSAGLFHTDPIIVTGSSIIVEIPDGFEEVPKQRKRRKFKHSSRRAKIVEVEIASGTSGEVLTFRPKNGKCKIKVRFRA